MTLALALLAGCKSKEDAAIDTAKKQAAATGQAQQVVSVDKNGNTTTVTVQPPAPGQTAQAVTTTVTPAAGAPANTTPWPAPAVAPGQPAIAGQNGGAAQPVAAAACGRAGGAPVIRPADVNIPAGTNLTDPHQSAHQREDEPRRATASMARSSSRSSATTTAWCFRRERRWQGSLRLAQARTLQGRIDSGTAADFADAERHISTASTRAI